MEAVERLLEDAATVAGDSGLIKLGEPANMPYMNKHTKSRFRLWVLVSTLAIMGVATEMLEPYLPRTVLFSVTHVAVLSAALSIFLVFRFNEAYERRWEARKLWGRLVNMSRDFARQSLTLLSHAVVGRSVVHL